MNDSPTDWDAGTYDATSAPQQAWADDVLARLDGLASGAVYAALALALVLIHRSTGLVNFAQGEIAMFSTYVAFTLTQRRESQANLAVWTKDRAIPFVSIVQPHQGGVAGFGVARFSARSNQRVQIQQMLAVLAEGSLAPVGRGRSGRIRARRHAGQKNGESCDGKEGARFHACTSAGPEVDCTAWADGLGGAFNPAASIIFSMS